MASNPRPEQTFPPPSENPDDSMMTEGIQGSLPKANTTSSASTVLRRSSRIQESPRRPNYSFSLNTSKGRKTVSNSLKRSGLEKKDFKNLPNLLNSSGDGDDEKVKETDKVSNESVPVQGKLKRIVLDKLEGCSSGVKMMLAALTLVLMLVVAEQGVYYSYILLCRSANTLSGARAMFYSVPEIVSFESKAGEKELLSDIEKFKSKVESEMNSLRETMSLIQIGVSNDKFQDTPVSAKENLEIVKNIDEIKRDFENQRIEHLKLLKQLDKHQNVDIMMLEQKIIELSNEIQRLNSPIETISNIGKTIEIDYLKTEIDNLKDAIESEDKGLNSFITAEETILIVSEKFPSLLTVGKKFEDFEMRTHRLEEKLDFDANISSVMEEYSDSLSRNLESQVQTQVKAALKENDLRKDTGRLVDWASAALGAEVAPTPDTRSPHAYSMSGLKLFGLRIWSRKPSPGLIIQRPHSGDCWPFSGTSGTLIFKLKRPVTLKKLAVQQIPSIAAPKTISVWDHERNIEMSNISLAFGDPNKQIFEVDHSESVGEVRLTVLDNWGDTNMTCVGMVQLLALATQF